MFPTFDDKIGYDATIMLNNYKRNVENPKMQYCSAILIFRSMKAISCPEKTLLADME